MSQAANSRLSRVLNSSHHDVVASASYYRSPSISLSGLNSAFRCVTSVSPRPPPQNKLGFIPLRCPRLCTRLKKAVHRHDNQHMFVAAPSHRSARPHLRCLRPRLLTWPAPPTLVHIRHRRCHHIFFYLFTLSMPFAAVHSMTHPQPSQSFWRRLTVLAL